MEDDVTRFRVRPFETTIDGGESRLPVHVKGEVRAGEFAFILNGIPFVVPTHEIGQDSRGPYAVVPITDTQLSGGLMLSVDPEPAHDDPEAPSGSCIAPREPHPSSRP